MRSDQAARRRFSASSTICATSFRRTGLPFFQAMTRFWYSAADFSWSLASMVEARCEPSKLPLAWLTLAATMAVRTSSSDRPSDGERAGVGLDAHGRAPAAGDADEAHAFHLRQLGREPVLGEVVQLDHRQRRRGDRDRQHRRIGRVDLAVDRRHRQVARQQVAAGVDGRLHLLLGHVERQAERETQRDHRRAARARGRHLVQARASGRTGAPAAR